MGRPFFLGSERRRLHLRERLRIRRGEHLPTVLELGDESHFLLVSAQDQAGEQADLTQRETRIGRAEGRWFPIFVVVIDASHEVEVVIRGSDFVLDDC